MKIAARFLTVLMLFLVITSSASGFSDTVQVASRMVAPGFDYSFPIYCYLHQSHTGFEIPIAFSSYDLVFDSAGLQGTIAPLRYELTYRIDEDSASMLIFIFPFPPTYFDEFIDPPGGKLCEVYFHVRDFAPDQYVFIDTAAFPLYDEQADTLIQYYDLSGYDTDGIAIAEDFIFGTISIYTDIRENDDQGAVPDGYRLFQNYPNPFNPATTISFQLPAETDVSLEVLNILGQRVSAVNMGSLQPGRHNFYFNGGDFESGFYYYRIRAGDFSAVRKMLLIK